MADRLVQIADGFYNIRGSFKIGGLVNIGTQASFARLSSGGFAMLDAYTLQGEVLDEVMALTDGGRAVERVLNLHPFHTLHVKAVAERFPDALWHGSVRHVQRAPEVKWQALRVEDPALHEALAEDFTFTVPRGVDYISPNEKLHFSSVLALHKASGTLHVDDTLMWVSLPLVGGLSFHPTLKDVLERRPGAAADFRAWAEELIALCGGVTRLVTAHARALPPKELHGEALAEALRRALTKVEGSLAAHEGKHG